MVMTAHLLASIDEAFDGRSWHGTNLRGSLRGVSIGAAAWRPASAKASVDTSADRSAGEPRDRHNIWELLVHTAYWKYDVRRKLTGEQSRSFAIEGSNFWRRPVDGTLAEWRADLALLEAEHDRLRDAVAAFPASRWNRKSPRKPFTFAGLVRGIAAHDLYHAGQIQLLRRLQE